MNTLQSVEEIESTIKIGVDSIEINQALNIIFDDLNILVSHIIEDNNLIGA